MTLSINNKIWQRLKCHPWNSIILNMISKIELLQIYFQKVYQTNFSAEIENICSIYYKLIKEYQLKYKTGENVHQSSVTLSVELNLVQVGKISPLTLFDLFVCNTINNEFKLELYHYLKELILPKPS